MSPLPPGPSQVQVLVVPVGVMRRTTMLPSPFCCERPPSHEVQVAIQTLLLTGSMAMTPPGRLKLKFESIAYCAFEIWGATANASTKNGMQRFMKWPHFEAGDGVNAAFGARPQRTPSRPDG